LSELGFPTTIARMAIDQRSAVVIPDLSAQQPESIGLGKSALLLRIRSVMCVPILSGEEIAGLIYVYKTRPLARPFDQRDLQLAVAISHQAALTIQRTRLLKRIRQEQRVRQLLQRFLPSSEAEHFLQDYLQTGRLPELQEQTLTVLFADIRDSTGLAERLGAWRFSRILSRYYQEMTEAVFAHNGLLNKYLGDGLMAVFGVTRKQTATPEEQAVLSALEMLNRLDDLNRVEGEKIEIGIGVNTGSTIAGYVGTEERIEFTVLGDTVNVAQRLQEQARPNRVFVGAATRLAINGNYNFRPVGRVELRGRTQPIEAFEVLRV
jgi:adenylate cyclase